MLKCLHRTAALRSAIVVVLITTVLLMVSLDLTISLPTPFRTELQSKYSNWNAPREIGHLVEALRNGKRSFEWSEWLNLDRTNLFHKMDLDSKTYPNLAGKNLTSITYPLYNKASSSENAMIGSLFCRHNMSHPSRIIVLGDPSDKNTRGKFEIFDLAMEDQKKCHKQYGHSLCSRQETLGPLVQQLSPNSNNTIDSIDRLSVDISEDLFNWNVDVERLLEDSNTQDSEPGRHAHAVMLQQALANVNESGKHFYEVPLQNDPLGYGMHYDWRFFRDITGYKERSQSIHSAARAWSQFADAFGIVYWYAHGSLLGWWWNGLTMPWDNDHDIQMPILELDRLARTFNGTLIVTDAKEGANMYYIDVGPWYVEREQGNGNNLIDARFIDVNHGTYIDITGLAFSASSTKVTCKNDHDYSIKELSPLRRTLFEGSASMVPKESRKLLQREYKKFDSHNYGSWIFNERIQLWQIMLSCEDYRKNFHKSAKVFCFPKKDLPKDQCDYDMFQTCDQPSLEMFNKTHAVTGMHQIENELWQKVSSGYGADTRKKLAELLDTYYPPIP